MARSIIGDTAAASGRPSPGRIRLPVPRKPADPIPTPECPRAIVVERDDGPFRIGLCDDADGPVSRRALRLWPRRRLAICLRGCGNELRRDHRPALPRARDKSDAIFNRCLILEMTNVISEEDAVKARRDAGVPTGKTIGDLIVEKEGAGILNWMIEGLRDLMRRGSFVLPGAVVSATQRFQDDNNPVHEWARTSIVRAPGGKVARRDLLCAIHGWQREQDGDEARAFGARGFFPRLRAAAPWIGDFQDYRSGKRYVTGIHLTSEGLQQWEAHNTGPQLRGGSTGLSMSKIEVNRMHSGGGTEEEKAPDEPRF
jgi:hypothetical protein